jgi:Flp pilus assembly protein TadD
VGLARVALARGENAEAVERLRSAVQKSPGDFLAHRLLSHALVAAGHEDEARAAAAASERLPTYRGWLTFDERVRMAHRHAQTQQSLENELRTAIARGESSAALRIARSLMSRRPDDGDMMITVATLLFQTGDLLQAEQMIDEAMWLEERSTAPLRLRAEMAFVRQDYAAARTAAQALLQTDPRNARAHDILGRVSFLEGNRDEGILGVRTAVQLDPVNVESRKVLVAMLKEAGRIQEAVVELEALRTLDPNDAWARQQVEVLTTQPSS